MTKEEVIDLMESSKSAHEWNSNCDTVKKAHNNDYPGYWFEEILLSGLCDRVLGKGSSDIKITTGQLPSFEHRPNIRYITSGHDVPLHELHGTVKMQ